MPLTRILLVDDDELIRVTLTELLEQSGFAVTSVTNVVEALKHISSESYDVLLSDLHMPGAGDGLTVVSAMRHANPLAVTLLLSAFPQMEAAAQAILLQADEILFKPMDLTLLLDVIKQRVAMGPVRNRQTDTVAEVLERTAGAVVQDWYKLILAERLVMSVPMSHEVRCAHLPQFFRELVARLLSSKRVVSKASVSPAASIHGMNRRRMGYTPAMLVEESRLLQVTLFKTIQNNLAVIDPSLLVAGVMAIADEVDSQLSQAMASFIEDSPPEARPHLA